MKIVMSGSASDTLDWQKHIRSRKRREELAKAFKLAALDALKKSLLHQAFTGEL